MMEKDFKKQIKILVVEDYATNREIIRSYLSAGRYLLSFAENGQQALEAIRNGSFDLILMDVQMPVMDGFEATRAIRKAEAARRQATSSFSLQPSPNPAPSSFSHQPSALPHIPIIAMTAQVMQEDEKKYREAGMDDYIGKPFRRKELLAMMEKWIHPV